MFKRVTIFTVILIAFICQTTAHSQDADATDTRPQAPRILSMQEVPGASEEKTGNQSKQNCGSEQTVSIARMPKKDFLDKVALFVNGGLFVVGIGGLVIAGLANRSNKISFERQLRAYVMPDTVSVVNVVNPVEDPEDPYEPTLARVIRPKLGPIGKMLIKNTGQTPAYQVKHWGDMCFREYPLTGPLSERGRNGREMPTFIGVGVINVKNYGDVDTLTELQSKQLHDGTHALYVHGEIRYRDAFGREHYTRYRLMHGRVTGRMGVTTDLTFCEEGNEAD